MQLPETLAVLARSNNVIAITIVVNEDENDLYFSGDQERVNLDLPIGDHTLDDTLHVVRGFTVRNNPPMMMMHAEFPKSAERADTDSFKSIVVLDRSATIGQIQREARNRTLIFVLGTLLLLAMGAVWQFTVRLAQSEGTTQVLKAETRHLQELGQAAAGLAHETRNPLGLIRGWTQRLAEAGLPSDEQQEQAEAVLEECDRVTARINQFLAFARQPDVNAVPVAVAELVQELQALLQSDLDARELKLNQAGLDNQPAIKADRDQLRQLLFNLLQNAIPFAPNASTITISMCPSQRGAFQLAVADQGPGAADEIVDSLFEPYVTKRPGGTGLGLSIVRRIALAHDWDVSYKAGIEGGSVFTIDGIRKA